MGDDVRVKVRLSTLAITALLVLAACGQQAQPTPASPMMTPPPTQPTGPTQPPGTEPSPAEPTQPPGTEPSPAEPTQPPATEPTDGPPASPPTEPTDPPPVAFERLADGLGNLTFLTHAGDGSGRLFVVEQRGVVRILASDGQLADEPFLDIADRVSAGGERGLLGLAFHPDFRDNGRFFVNYSDTNGDNVIAQFQASEDRSPELVRDVLRIEQPFGNHNGGMLAFGPDGYLYISSGDGGGAGDPLQAGQDRSTLLGKLLRIDVDAEPYAIPPNNPFADGADGARPEIWAYGLRNPWRLSFDRESGALFIADVGQDRWEEVNVEPAGEGGRNYGWNVMEGPECFRQSDCDTSGLAMPVAWYPTGNDCAITGGYVYRGAEIANLTGFYLFSDFCSGTVWALDAGEALRASELPVPVYELGSSGINVTAFGEDEAGELYLVGAGGEILRVVAGD
jgi:glucose/arabinose dehydrogenase